MIKQKLVSTNNQGLTRPLSFTHECKLLILNKEKRKTLSKGGKYMADFDREIYGESISECKVNSKSPKNVNSNSTRSIDYNL